MVSAAKAFSKEPPREPLDNLKAIVDDFQWRYVDRKKTDQVIKYCAEADTFSSAVQRAVESRDENGKHHNHQSKVDITARRLFGRRIMVRRYAIKKILNNRGDSFDQLHDLLDDIKPHGIGPVTVYDVAVRVGAYLGAEPTSVYMHAGVRQGCKALEGALRRTDGPDIDGFHRAKHVPVERFPWPLCDLRADDVEDILCTYREVFEGWE